MTTSIERYRMAGACLQLVLIAICFEMLLGVSAGMSLQFRLLSIGLICVAIGIRWAWLGLMVLQCSLLFNEPARQPIAAIQSNFAYPIVALLVLVATMRVGNLHKAVTDLFLQNILLSETSQTRTPLRFPLVRIGIQLQLVVICVFMSMGLLYRLPIGRQTSSWLQWSSESGQAIWPGTLLLVLLIALWVIMRELAWRQLQPSQASLYLRSVQLIENYRDLFGFERHRLKRLRNRPPELIESKAYPVNRPKLRDVKSKRKG
jgi:hypothetical protein